jgi:hypothetical protein
LHLLAILTIKLTTPPSRLAISSGPH